MTWGTRRDDDDLIHVVPCTTDGTLLPPHRFDRDCPCQPQPDPDHPDIIVHNEVH